MNTPRPGQWIFQSTPINPSGDEEKLILDESGVVIARVVDDPKHDVANGHLLAAAPFLLSACENLIAELEAHGIHTPIRLQYAKNAVEKAGVR